MHSISPMNSMNIERRSDMAMISNTHFASHSRRKLKKEKTERTNENINKINNNQTDIVMYLNKDFCSVYGVQSKQRLPYLNISYI